MTNEENITADGSGIPSEEDFLPSPPKVLGPLTRLPPGSNALPAVFCFLFFALVSVLFWRSSLSPYLSVSGENIYRDHEYYRLFTALFVHADFGHLLSNAPLFLIFGWFLHGFFGSFVFPCLSFAIGTFANLATVHYYPPETTLIGASGMLYGMVGLWLTLYVRFDVDHSVFMRLFRALAFSLIVLFPTTFQPQVSYLAHAFGFAFGILGGLGIIPFIKVRDVKS